MEAQANPITKAVLDHLPVLEFLRSNGEATPAEIASATGRVPSNVRRDLPKLVEANLLSRASFLDGPETFALEHDGQLALEAIYRARNPNLAEVAPTTGLHAEFAPNPDQPRKKFDEQKLEELADTVEEVGIIEPIVVLAPREDGLKLIHAGERRWRAAGIVNARHDDPNRVRIPFVIRDVAAEDAALEAQVVALVENGQRENLTTYEEAVALRALIPAKYRSARAAAKPTGFDEKTVQDRLKALEVLKGDDLEAWKADTMTWRQVRDIFRPPVQAEADPAQMDIEDVTGPASPAQQVPMSLRSDKSLNDRLAEMTLERRRAAIRDSAEYFSNAVKEAALAEARSEPGASRSMVNARLAGKTTIEGETWPERPTENLATPWDGHPRAVISLTVSDKGRWGVALKTEAGGPSYSGQSSPPYVYTCDPLFRSRHDALVYAADRIVDRLGEVWGRKRNLQNWLESLTTSEPVSETIEATSVVAPVEPVSEMDAVQARYALTAVEVIYKLEHQNEGTAEERYVRVGPYWLDARVSDLVAAKLLSFFNLGGEDGWAVRKGEHMDEWLKDRGLWHAEYDCESINLATVDTFLKAAGLDPEEYRTKFATPWLEVEPAGISDQLPATDGGDEAASEDLFDDEFDETEVVRAQEILGRVADHITDPASLGELLHATGLLLPLRVSLTDAGVVLDGNGMAIFTVDQDSALPDALAAARALLIVAAVNAHDIGREITGQPPASVVAPDKMTGALMRKSIYPDHLVCLEDGRRFTDLAHHLRVEHDMDQGEYLARWKLPNDYPFVAPATAVERERAATDNATALLRSLTR